MPNRTRRTTYITMLLIGAIFAQPALAAEFNPSAIISDEEMQQSSTMTREDIQAFLDEKGGFIASLRFADVDNVIRDTADIIARAALKYTINPKYLLVKLQKEQSLVTDKDPTQKQLDWATGYGICDACSMNDPSLQKHRGFGNQVDSAAGIMRWYYDNYTNETWIKRAGQAYNIDSQTVVPTSLATAFLYTYTPHIQGNKNFWTLWQQWFDQVYPDGSLLTSPEDSTVYLIQQKKKHPFANYSALVTRYNPDRVITVPEAELARYPEAATISLRNFAVVQNNGMYYLIDGLTKRKFASSSVVRTLGYYPEEIENVTDAALNAFEEGLPISVSDKDITGRLVTVKGTSIQYFLKNNEYHPIYDARIAAVSLSNVAKETIDASEIGSYKLGSPVLLPDGALFGIEGEAKIYVVEQGKKRHIASEEIFNGLGYDWNDIVWINTFAGMAHETGEPIYLKRNYSDSPAGTTTEPSSTEEELAEQTDISSLMVRTPADEFSYIGPTFTTDIDAYLVMDYATGDILAGKNVDTVRPLASLTKVQTAYTAIYHGLQTGGSTTYHEAEHKSMYHKYLIGEGDQVLNADLLKAMLVSSLNTPAKMLADSTAGSDAAFLKLMKEDLANLGLSKTTIIDPAGEAVGTVSTAREYAQMFKRAVRNGDIRDILAMESYEYSKVKNVSGIRETHFDNHTNALTRSAHPEYKILASKTGYLYESGANLAMMVERTSDGKRFIILTMGNADIANRFVDPDKLTSWALNQF